MPENFEVTVGDYGRMVFEMFLDERWSDLPDHWKSIKKEALPLVKKLLKLNEKMEGGGYKITGIKKKGKVVLPDWKRIMLAQEQTWGVKASALKQGDRVWLTDSDFDMDVHEDPATVMDVTSRGIYIDTDQPHRVVIVDEETFLLKAPDDWHEDMDIDWLQKADELGI